MTPSLYRAGDRATALGCTRLLTCGLTYTVAEDQKPGGKVRLRVGPVLDIEVDPQLLTESYE